MSRAIETNVADRVRRLKEGASFKHHGAVHGETQATHDDARVGDVEHGIGAHGDVVVNTQRAASGAGVTQQENVHRPSRRKHRQIGDAHHAGNRGGSGVNSDALGVAVSEPNRGEIGRGSHSGRPVRGVLPTTAGGVGPAIVRRPSPRRRAQAFHKGWQ